MPCPYKDGVLMQKMRKSRVHQDHADEFSHVEYDLSLNI
jgi:hypothetical protein